jgi:hypothetical protein
MFVKIIIMSLQKIETKIYEVRGIKVMSAAAETLI